MWSVEPETELLTLYQGVTYTTFAALGGAWPAAAPKSSTEITTCAPHEEKSTTEPRPVPAVEAQRTVNSEGTRTFVFFLVLVRVLSRGLFCAVVVCESAGTSHPAREPCPCSDCPMFLSIHNTCTRKTTQIAHLSTHVAYSLPLDLSSVTRSVVMRFIRIIAI